MPHAILVVTLAVAGSAAGSLVLGLTQDKRMRRRDATPVDGAGMVDAAQLLAAELADRVGAAFGAVYVAPNGERAELVATTIPPPTLPPLPALVRRALSTRRFVSASRSELAELRRP